MSISSEITRIQNKRDLSFQEVQNKGVTVPAGSTIDDLPGLIALIEGGGGGTTVTNGIVATARNADGYPISIDFYGQLFPYALGAGRIDVDYYLGKLENVVFKDKITEIPEYAFFCAAARGNGITSLTFPDVTFVGKGVFNGSSGNGAKIGTLSLPALESIPATSQSCFASRNLGRIFLPKLTTIQNTNISYGICRLCTSMTYAEIGSIGYAAPDNIKYQFRDCTQATLTICIYTLGSRIDSILTTLRTYATNATIVFKASEVTSYNGTSYTAGDTILTSEVA